MIDGVMIINLTATSQESTEKLIHVLDKFAYISYNFLFIFISSLGCTILNCRHQNHISTKSNFKKNILRPMPFTCETKRL
jgi:hypothetical protein